MLHSEKKVTEGQEKHRSSGSAEEDKNPKSATASKKQLRRARSVHNGFCTEERGNMRSWVDWGKQTYADGWFRFKQTADLLELPLQLFFSLALSSPVFWQRWSLFHLAVCAGVEHSSGTQPAVTKMTSRFHYGFKRPLLYENPMNRTSTKIIWMNKNKLIKNII